MKVEEGASYRVYGEDMAPLEGELLFVDGYEVWPQGVDGWSDVLDCTVEPYNERTLAENLEFAHHIHKEFILMKE